MTYTFPFAIVGTLNLAAGPALSRVGFVLLLYRVVAIFVAS